MGRPKALLQWRGLPFVEHVCASLRAAGVEDRVVVLGRASEEILASWRPAGERLALNARPEDGQLSSLRAGLGLASEGSVAFMVCLADQPTILPATYKAIISFWRAHQDSIVIPRCERTAQDGTQGENPKAEAAVNTLSQLSDSSLSTLHSPLSFKRGHPIIVPAAYRRLCFEGPLEKGLHWVTHHPSVKIADLEVDDREIIRDFDTPEQYQQLDR